MNCPMCNGPLMLLGKLGNRTHYNCRNCGIQVSRGNKQKETVKKTKKHM